MNPNETLTIVDYISRLFPDMTHSEVQQAASVYKGYGTALQQAIMVMSDCKSCSEAVRTTASLTGPRSHLSVPDVLPPQDVCRSCVEGSSTHRHAHLNFDASSGSLCHPTCVPHSRRSLLLFQASSPPLSHYHMLIWQSNIIHLCPTARAVLRHTTTNSLSPPFLGRSCPS